MGCIVAATGSPSKTRDHMFRLPLPDRVEHQELDHVEPVAVLVEAMARLVEVPGICRNERKRDVAFPRSFFVGPPAKVIKAPYRGAI